MNQHFSAAADVASVRKTQKHPLGVSGASEKYRKASQMIKQDSNSFVSQKGNI